MTVAAWNENARLANATNPDKSAAWLVDPITWANKKELLMFSDTGEAGNYMILRSDGSHESGIFSSALPTIGDALFTKKAGPKATGYAMRLYEVIAQDLDR